MRNSAPRIFFRCTQNSEQAPAREYGAAPGGGEADCIRLGAAPGAGGAVEGCEHPAAPSFPCPSASEPAASASCGEHGLGFFYFFRFIKNIY